MKISYENGLGTVFIYNYNYLPENSTGAKHPLAEKTKRPLVEDNPHGKNGNQSSNELSLKQIVNLDLRFSNWINWKALT